MMGKYNLQNKGIKRKQINYEGNNDRHQSILGHSGRTEINFYPLGLYPQKIVINKSSIVSYILKEDILKEDLKDRGENSHSL